MYDPSPASVGADHGGGAGAGGAAHRLGRYGNELCQRLNLTPGSMYPILMWLADRGLLETTWNTDAPAGRPPRHRYRLTGSGRALAVDLVAAPPRRPDLKKMRWQGA
jgi:PadR family transcriptional regulator PadR